MFEILGMTILLLSPAIVTTIITKLYMWLRFYRYDEDDISRPKMFSAQKSVRVIQMTVWCFCIVLVTLDLFSGLYILSC